MQTPRCHIIFDLDACRPEAVRDADGLKNFLREMVDAIGMHILVGPEIAEGIPENPGLSSFAIIDYSHVSVHTFSRYNEAMIDIFSCKPFDRDVARQKCLDYFGTTGSSIRTQEIWWQT